MQQNILGILKCAWKRHVGLAAGGSGQLIKRKGAYWGRSAFSTERQRAINVVDDNNNMCTNLIRLVLRARFRYEVNPLHTSLL